MIRILCVHCHQTLEIDDAFAGGVCRCQYCGTIQTVPSRDASGKSVRVAAKSLYRSQGGSGSGLEQLADIVSSSGLSPHFPRPKRPSVNEGLPPAAKRKMAKWLALAGVVIVLLLAVIIALLLRVNHR